MKNSNYSEHLHSETKSNSFNLKKKCQSQQNLVNCLHATAQTIVDEAQAVYPKTKETKFNSYLNFQSNLFFLLNTV